MLVTKQEVLEDKIKKEKDVACTLEEEKKVRPKLGSNTNSPCVDMALGYLNFTYSRK